MKRKSLTLPRKLDKMFGQVVVDLRGSRGEEKDREKIRMYSSTDENWSGQRQERNMINKIKLDWYKHKQFLGEILSDLEYWKFEYEVRLENGTLIIEIYGAGK